MASVGALYEQEVAQRWWSLAKGSLLRSVTGDIYRVLFTGYPGSSAGPDVRDAVLCAFPPGDLASARMQHGGKDTINIVGDVEFHIRSSDWLAHQHHTDPRYNNVMLHVVLLCDDPYPTTRADGVRIPVCSLNDLPSMLPVVSEQELPVWPCHQTMPALSREQQLRLLRCAGRLRFEQKVELFIQQVRMRNSSATFDDYNTCLIPALAEGLGFGRDRAIFRVAGLYLLGQAETVPEPLGRAPAPTSLDAGRLRALRALVEQWRSPGVWQMLQELFLSHAEQESSDLLQKLRSIFCDGGISLARTDILLCNVILPFAGAVAVLENRPALRGRVQELYETHPGLPSNRITRLMCAQLRLEKMPRGSCQQQGLHYIYQQTCREKRCHLCIARKMTV